MITSVLVMSTGLVAVFDEHGQQMPEYQGPIEEVAARIAPIFAPERWGWPNYPGRPGPRVGLPSPAAEPQLSPELSAILDVVLSDERNIAALEYLARKQTKGDGDAL